MSKPSCTFRETYPGPWEIIEHQESISVRHNGTILAYIYVEDEPVRRRELRRVTWAEGRALAKAIAGLGSSRTRERL